MIFLASFSAGFMPANCSTRLTHDLPKHYTSIGRRVAPFPGSD